MTQDLYYVESGYLTPDSGYYVYTADAESAVSTSATMDITAGVIKDCVSTITCQASVSAVVSHIHGADLVAFSNAAIATEINVIRATNVALTSVFSAAIDAVRGIYVSAQADSTATISISSQRVRFTEAAVDAAFSLACDATKILGGTVSEAEATLFNSVSLSATVDRFSGTAISVSSEFNQTTQAERFSNCDIAVESLFNVDANLSIVAQAVISASSSVTSTVSASITRDFIINESSAFTPTLSVDVFKNSFAVLDSQASLTADISITRLASVSLDSQANISVSTTRLRTTEINANTSSSLTSSIVGLVDVQASIDGVFTTSTTGSRTRNFLVTVGSAFYPTVSVKIFKNSFAVLDSVSTLTTIANASQVAQANISSQTALVASTSVYKFASTSLSSEFTSTVVGIKPTRVVGDPTVVSGAGYSDLTIDTSNKKFGAGSLRFGSRSSYVTNHSLSIAGNPLLSTNHKKFGTKSLSLDGSGDNLSANFDPDFTFGTGDYTIELWIRPITLSGTNYIVSLRNDASTAPLSVLYLNNGVLRYANPNTTRITGSTLNVDTWYHIALARSGTSTKLFVNGTQVGSTYTDSSNYVTGRPVFGSDYQNSAGSNFRGYIDEIRISVGIARYTSNFTEPTQPFTPDSYTQLLVHNDTDISDTSADWQTILSVPSVSYPDSSKWTNWKTIDFWLYITAGYPTTGGIWHSVIGQGLVGTSNYWSILLESSGGGTHLYAFASGAGGTWGESSYNASNFAANQWNHIRLIYDAGSIALFVNGTKKFTWTSVSIGDIAEPLLIGGNGGFVGNYGTGDVYYDEVMISDVALSSVSDTTITVPTSPYSNTANTSLLLHFDSNFFDDASQIPLTLSANASLSSASNLTVSSIIDVSAEANLTAVSSLTATGSNTKEINLVAFSNANLAAYNQRTRNLESSQTAVATVNSDVIAIRPASASLASSVSLTASSERTRDADASLSAFITELTLADRLAPTTVSLSSQFTSTVIAVKSAETSASLAGESTLTATTDNSLTGSLSSSQSSEFTQSTDSSRTRTLTSTQTAFASELIVIGKVGQGLIGLDVTATMTVSAEVTSGSVAYLSSQTQLTANNTILRLAESDLVVSATLIANAVSPKTFSASLTAVSTVACEISKITGFIALEAGSATLTADTSVIRRTEAHLDVLAFELAIGSRAQTAQAELVSTSSLTAGVGGTFGFRSAMSGFAAEVAVIDIIHIDAKLTWMIFADDRDYSIQSDTRVYSITAEDRDYSIESENREYAVTRELLTTELQGV